MNVTVKVVRFLAILLLALPAVAQIGAVIVPGQPGPVEDVPADLVLQAGHTRRVTALAFSPDGVRLASAGEDGTVRLWDPARGVQVLRLTGHAGPVRAIAFSPDGRQLASGSDDRTVRIWDAATGRALFTLAGHDAPVAALAFSPDGGLLVSGGEDVRLWDAAEGQEVAVLARGAFGLTALLFAPEGVLAAFSGGDMEIRGVVKVYDPESGRMVGRRAQILRAASQDGSRLALQEGQWTGQTVRVEPDGFEFGGDIGPVAFSPQGDWVAWSQDQRAAVTVASAVGGQPARTLQGGPWEFERLAVSPDGSLAATAGSSGAVTVWDVARGRRLHELAPRPVLAVAFSPDGRRVTTGVRTWKLPSGDESAGPATGQPIGVAFHPDGLHLATAATGVQLWDTRPNRLVREFQCPADVAISPAFSPDGRYLAANCRGIVTVWDAATGAQALRLGRHDLMNSGAVAFTPDGRQLVAGAGPGLIRIYDLATGGAVRDLPLPGSLAALAFSPDGRTLAAGSRAQMRLRQDGAPGFPFEPAPGQAATIAVWDLDGGRQLWTVPAGEWVNALAFTRDGGAILAASGELERPGRVRLLDAASGRAIRTVVEKVDAQQAAAISPDLGWLAGAGRGDGVKLWKLR